jgi:hypothetical protein
VWVTDSGRLAEVAAWIGGADGGLVPGAEPGMVVPGCRVNRDLVERGGLVGLSAVAENDRAVGLKALLAVDRECVLSVCDEIADSA